MERKNIENRTALECFCKTIICLVCLFLVQGCNEKKLTAIPKDGVILAFGDSLTAGVGVNKKKSYPTILAQLSGRKVVNAGISGEITAEGRTRILETIEQEKPNLILLLEGGNDILRNRNLQQTKRNLAAMIEIAQDEGVDIVLIGVPEKKLFSGVASFYEELAEEYNLVFEADLIGDLLRKPQYKSDMIHFNEPGYRLMAESLFQLLQKNGAL